MSQFTLVVQVGVANALCIICDVSVDQYLLQRFLMCTLRYLTECFLAHIFL